MLRLVTDLQAIRYNVERIKKKSDKRIYAVVKANAYGHGAAMVAAHTEDLVDGFAVATVNEGIALRNAGVTKPIIVLSFDVNNTGGALEYGLTPCVYTKAHIDALSICGVRHAHLAIDSGMHREGVRPEYAQDILKYAKYRGVSIDAVYTHYACADSINKQNKEFDAVDFDGLRHTSATSAYISGLDSYDCLRVGLAVYGYPSGYGFITALKVTSNVLNVLDVKRGESIGYDLAYTPERDAKIAIVGGGYADGIKRSYSGAEVLINGERVSIVGRVCMDSFSVDVKDVDVKVGDEVVIIGDGLTAETFAKKANTIPYEVLCGFDTKRARRYYV